MMQSTEELKNKEQGIRCVLTHSAYSRKERLQVVGQTEVKVAESLTKCERA